MCQCRTRRICFVELYIEASLSEFEEWYPYPDAAKRLDNYINQM